MKVTKIGVSLSGTIPTASYENLKPGFSIEIEINDNKDVRKAFQHGRKFLHEMMSKEENQAKADYLSRVYANFRWYEADGKRYISVTTVLGIGLDFHMPDQELNQYASRGTVVGHLVETYLAGGGWIDPEKCPKLQEDVEVLVRGNLGLHWSQCSHVEFCEQFGDKITIEKTQGVVINKEALYGGTYDILGTYEDKRSVMDIKSGTFDMRQLAAYAVCLEGIEQLVVLPVGPTENKCGYKKPVVCTTIQKKYAEFLKARAKFKHRFGI